MRRTVRLLIAASCAATWLWPLGCAAVAAPADTPSKVQGRLSAKDIFGGKGGYVHPYLSLGIGYNDNVYQAPDNTVSDLATVLSGGIWFSLPGSREKRIAMETNALSPGGMRMDFRRDRDFQRFKAYLHLGGRRITYNEESEGDATDLFVDGLLEYNLRGGLTMQLLDIYRHGHEDFHGGTIRDRLQTYDSNLASVRILYDLGHRFRLRGDAGIFTIGYEDEPARNRLDQSYSTYLYYDISPKTSAFVQYTYLDVSYDERDDRGSQEHHFLGGLRWRSGGKTSGAVRVGYGIKDFQNPATDRGSELLFSGWVDYRPTGKTKLRLLAYRGYSESDTSSASSVLTHRVKLSYTQKLRARTKLKASLAYKKQEYHDVYANGGPGARTDDAWDGSLSLHYRFRRWLSANLTYAHRDQQSDLPEYEYVDNRLLLQVVVAW